MKELLIIGARGFGREIYFFAQQCRGYGTDFMIKGFLDDKADALAALPGYAPILSSVENYVIQENDVFTCALGSVKQKQHYVELIKAKGGVFQQLIHASATIFQTSIIGEGCIISPRVEITADVRIGNYVTITSNSVIGHDVKIGNYCHLGAASFLGGYAELGDGVTLHPGAKVVPHKKVGAGATVGINSVVLFNIKPGVTVFGMPAMPV
ncbi:MAG: NeuD/PglB/VioB family sugar acetyltransferase [Verrucomicrobiota bacterium]